ncbi:MAG: Gfo/Idh/MocA family oxidoreductase [Cytophagales bacterium]|nr:Gfo/Idh/MocA family oxidoreductase [Bernardetiaceae bacterium]MDW8204061.1 Gfo/Idh/MocA family oxidoreductase [Cytophagales bacterium]
MTNTIAFDASRRDFIRSAGILTLGAATASWSAATFRPNSDTLRIGLIGCGGRGTGAASQALKADKNTVLTAMADIFEDHLEESYKNLVSKHGDRVRVSKEHRFIGLDAYRKLIHAGVDVVILASPPAFRPQHMEEAVAAGKHIFAEKPMAVDVPGLKRVLEATRKAREKKLAVVSGFCWRYDLPKRAIFSKILNGEIGEVVSILNTYNTGPAWQKDRQPNWNDAEFTLRNWPHFTWLSGDSIAEQAVHSLDMMSWALGDKPPVRVFGTGGRQVNTGKELGNIFDHFAIVYEYENGVKGYHFSRKQSGCSNSYLVEVAGTKGQALIDCMKSRHVITSYDNRAWEYRGEKNDMYQTEHDELFASIRSGQPLNDGEWMTQSTMLALIGRMAAYTGQTITWQEAWASKEVLIPDDLQWGQTLPAPMAVPGITKLL